MQLAAATAINAKPIAGNGAPWFPEPPGCGGGGCAIPILMPIKHPNISSFTFFILLGVV